jgi:hypothetical protein
MQGSAEFTNNIVTIGLPNGIEYNIQFDKVTGGLIINKSLPFDDTAITITPRVTNEIIIK